MRGHHFHEALGLGALAHEGQQHVIALRDEPHLVVVGTEGQPVAHLVGHDHVGVLLLELGVGVHEHIVGLGGEAHHVLVGALARSQGGQDVGVLREGHVGERRIVAALLQLAVGGVCRAQIGHGGGEETAAILGIDPSLVDQSEVAGPMKLHDVSDTLKATGFTSIEYKGVTVNIPRLTPSVTHNGWIGPDHPETATEERGRKMLQTTADYIVDFMEEFKKVDIAKACGTEF